MIASEIKRFGKRMAIAILLLIFGLVLLSNVRTVSAANIGDTITGDDTTGVVPGTTNNVSGTLGPLEFRLNTAEDEGSLAATLQILLVLTVITLAPSILIMLTAFTRIIIVLHFIRSALGTQTTPPNQVLIGLALFLTFYYMSPVITQVNANAITPLSRGEITQEEAFDAGAAPIRTFMLEQTNVKDLR